MPGHEHGVHLTFKMTCINIPFCGYGAGFIKLMSNVTSGVKFYFSCPSLDVSGCWMNARSKI